MAGPSCAKSCRCGTEGRAPYFSAPGLGDPSARPLSVGNHGVVVSRQGPQSDERAALSGRSHRSLGHFPFMRGEGRQDLTLLARRDPEAIERATQFGRDLVELVGGDVELAMGFLQAEGGAPRLRGAKGEGSTGDVTDPERPHELQPRQPVKLVGMPLTELGVLGPLTDHGVLDDRIAEVVDHRSDGEHATNRSYRLASAIVDLPSATGGVARQQWVPPVALFHSS